RLRDLWHLNRGHGPRGDARAFERILQRQRVDHRRQHAHVVAGRPVEASLGGGQAAEDVSSADHERDLDTHLVDAFDLRRDRLDDLKVDAVVPAAAKRLAAQLEQNPVVLGRTVGQLAQDSLMLNRAKRRTVMFSWSLEMFSAISWCTVRPGSRKYSCSKRQLCFRKSSTCPST